MGNIVEMPADLGVERRYLREVLGKSVELIVQTASLVLQTADLIAQYDVLYKEPITFLMS
jgi:hypothetical protein